MVTIAAALDFIRFMIDPIWPQLAMGGVSNAFTMARNKHCGPQGRINNRPKSPHEIQQQATGDVSRLCAYCSAIVRQPSVRNQDPTSRRARRSQELAKFSASLCRKVRGNPKCSSRAPLASALRVYVAALGLLHLDFCDSVHEVLVDDLLLALAQCDHACFHTHGLEHRRVVFIG